MIPIVTSTRGVNLDRRMSGNILHVADLVTFHDTAVKFTALPINKYERPLPLL
jgi:hypothetical protein